MNIPEFAVKLLRIEDKKKELNRLADKTIYEEFITEISQHIVRALIRTTETP